MIAPVFVDTNVFLYALDDADQKKQQAARAWRRMLWVSRQGRVSYQVLQEFYVNVVRKYPSSRDQARDEIRDLEAWQPVIVDGDVLERGWNIQDRYRLSFWDALIVAAAAKANCRYLLTEDLQEDQELEGMRIVNPFHLAPEELPVH